MSLRILAGAIALSLATVASAQQADKLQIEGHLRFLADDALEGRETGSRGYDVAADYVATRFQQYGVQPRGNGNSYLQSVPLRSARLVADSVQLELRGKSGSQMLAHFDDFVMGGSLLEAQSGVAAPLVFVGYGIESAPLKHNDYAGVDVKGKIVVMLGDKPARFPTEEGAHFGSNESRRAAALRHGAVGMVTLSTPASEKRVPFAKLRDLHLHPSMDWVDPAGKVNSAKHGVANSATLSLAAGRKLFADSGTDLDSIIKLAAEGKPLPSIDLKQTLRMAKRSTLAELRSNNVIGMIEGSDPQLKNEYVVLTAHLDHVGTIKEKLGDQIFNGAMDNASGVAVMLETARLFTQPGVKPKRSILFIALTGEEKGLLGAGYYASNPTVPQGALVANVNLDMPLLTYDFKSVMAFGAEHSSLKGAIERAVAANGVTLIPDPWPEMSLFTRSDHYMFVRQGVPSLFLVTGLTSFKAGENPDQLWKEFLGKRYHQPNDDLNQPFNFDAAARFAKINYSIALEIANAPSRPTWNKGNFFGDTFGKPL